MISEYIIESQNVADVEKDSAIAFQEWPDDQDVHTEVIERQGPITCCGSQGRIVPGLRTCVHIGKSGVSICPADEIFHHYRNVAK
jgi:hypothetical protein